MYGMGIHSLMAIATAMAGLTVASTAGNCGKSGLYPNISDNSHATPQAVSFFNGFFTEKSSDNGTALMKYYNPIQAQYFDSTLGLTIGANRSQLATNIIATENSWAQRVPNDRSYPLRILGDTIGGAVVYFIDTPGFFGAEVRTLTSFDFVNGTVIRQVDNWDGRGNAAKANSTGDPQYPNLGLPGLKERAASQMQTTASRLNAAFAAGNATAAAALFNYDAVFEDLTLRARVEGQIAISAYLARAIQKLPYGPGTNLTHVLGSATAGGYEWRPSGNTVRYGISALELDCSGNVTRFTAVWDGSRVSQATIQGLAILAVTP